MRWRKLAPVCGVLLLTVGVTSCNKLKARDQLNKGVSAFRNAQFQASITHFQNAENLDPSLLNARLYLATAYFQLYVPGGESPDNIEVGKQAIAAYQDVLQRDPSNANAIASIAQIYYNMKDFDNAKKYQRQLVQIQPDNPDPYHWIGMIDWGICYPKQMDLRKELNLTTPDKNGDFPPLKPKDAEKLASENGALIDEGIAALQKSLQLQPNDAGAMTYLNLMFRQKADIETDPSAREDDLKQANDLMQKAINLRKAETENAPESQ